jgi:hypothetical protein
MAAGTMSYYRPSLVGVHSLQNQEKQKNGKAFCGFLIVLCVLLLCAELPQLICMRA